MADPTNSFVENGKMHLMPSLTVDAIGEYELRHGHVKLDPSVYAQARLLPDIAAKSVFFLSCTRADFSGCERHGTPERIINPIRSSQLRTVRSFSFKFGKLEITAKLPTGDWLWPGAYFD